jgi:hypothetical protein
MARLPKSHLRCRSSCLNRTAPQGAAAASCSTERHNNRLQRHHPIASDDTLTAEVLPHRPPRSVFLHLQCV